MNKEQLSQRIGNIDDRLVAQAEHVPHYGRQRRSGLRRKIAGIAAVIVLMACSGAVGALAFSRETVQEVPAQQETVALAELKDERFIQLGPKASEEGFRYITNLCARCGIHPDFLLVEKMEDVMLWVQTGNGVAITSDRTIEGQNPHVVLRNIDMPEAKNHNITMAWRKNNYNPAIAIFYSMFEES